MEVTYKKIDHYFFDPTSKPLGKGAFGTVYKATDERTNTPVAVKVIPATKLLESQQQYDLFMREIQVLQQIKGTHIVCLLDVKQTSNNLYIFTDFCEGGDLEKKLKLKKSYPEEEALSILKQIADAFVSIHDMHIKNSKGTEVTMMHRDIKSANILFHEGRVKVADFGFAKFIEEAQQNTRQANTLLGTPLYMPPQILNDEKYSTKCDIWSTGVLAYELLFGQLPWTGNSIANLYKNILNKPLTFPKEVSKETKDLLSGMLQPREEKRFTWNQVYEHPALKHIDISGFKILDMEMLRIKEQAQNRRPSTKNELAPTDNHQHKPSPSPTHNQGHNNQYNPQNYQNNNQQNYYQNQNNNTGKSNQQQQSPHHNYNQQQQQSPHNYGYNNQNNYNQQQKDNYVSKESSNFPPEYYQPNRMPGNQQPHPSYK